MTQIYPDCSLLPLMAYMLAGANGIRVYPLLDNITPDLSTPANLGALTRNSAYPSTIVSQADFTTSSVAAHVATTLAAPIAVTNISAGTVTVYGYFYTDNATTNLLGIARFDTPVSVPNGGSIVVTPTFGDLSQYA